MDFSLENTWKAFINDQKSTHSYPSLLSFIDQQYRDTQVYPAQEDIYRALQLTPFDEVKVVILGQDPYHQPGQAHGLAFSVPKGVIPPPSLKNIYKEIENDLGIIKDMSDGDLRSWAKQGVLLLNTVLTVRKDSPGSHRGKGWEHITDAVIKKVSEEKEHCVFILWGAYAQKKAPLINSDTHLIIKSSHPSPLSAYRGFLGSKPFSQTNNYLQSYGQKPIQW